MNASHVEIQAAKNLGYNVERDEKFGHRFNKDCRAIWPVFIGNDITKPAWQTADIANGHYCNHATFKNLVAALNRPIDAYFTKRNDKILCRACGKRGWHKIWYTMEVDAVQKCETCKKSTTINSLRRAG